MNRRKLIESGLQTASVLALSSTIFPLLQSCGQNSLSSGGGSTNTTNATSSSSASTSTGNTATFSFSQFPSLQQAGGSIQTSITTSSGKVNVSVTRVSSSKAITVSTACTHEGCPVDAYDSSSETYTCECHGSVFNADGTVSQGPARTALTVYPTSIGSTELTITV